MIRAKIYVERYEWVVECFISVTHYACAEILASMRAIGCDGATLSRAGRKLSSGEINGGLTYTNHRARRSVMVTSLADSAKQQFNTITHEIAHVCAHIASSEGINPASEEFAYLVGDFSMELFPKVKGLLCECCRKKGLRYAHRP